MFRKQFILLLVLFSINRLYSQVIDTVCAGSIRSVYAVDNTQGSMYSWSVSGGDITDGNGTHKITVNWRKQPGVFKVSVIELNATGCIGQPQEGFVWVRGNKFAANSPDQACVNDTVTLKASGGLTYLWSNGATDSIIQIKLLTDTLLKVVISDTVCGFASDSFDIKVKAASKPVMSITSDVNSVFQNQPVNLFYNGNSNDRVQWQINKPNISNMLGQGINIRFSDTGEAVIKVISVNMLGCSDSSFTKVEIRQEQLFFPTAFTPNGDGLNDIFKPEGLGVGEFQLTIFNRWGQAIYSTQDARIGWDGTADGIPVQPDVYLYQCDMKGKSGKVYGYNGNITVIR